DVAAGLEPHFGAQGFVEFVLDAELFEDGRFLGVQLDAADQLGLKTADEFDDLAEFFFAVDPDGGEIVANVIAQDAFDEIQIAMEKRGSFALLAALLDFVPGSAEEFYVSANFFIGSAAGRGAYDEAAGIAAARFADEAAQTRAIVGAGDFARDTDVIDGRHVHEEAARQSDVTGDARALFAERLLGDLDDYILTSLEHFGDELRAARRTGVMASLVPAIMTRTAWPAGTAFEALAGASTAAAAFRASTTTVGASATAIWTATAIIAAAITSATAERALETLARIATNARGLARKFLPRRGCAATCAARSTGFSRQQNNVVLGDGRCRGSRNEIVHRDVPGVGSLRFFLAVGSFMMPFVMLGARAMLFVVKFKCCMMLGTFVRGIGFRFGTIGRASFFDLRRFVVGKLRNFGVGLFGFGFFLYFIDFLFFFLFFKNRVTGESGNLRNFLHFLLLGFDEAGPECRDLILV